MLCDENLIGKNACSRMGPATQRPEHVPQGAKSLSDQLVPVTEKGKVKLDWLPPTSSWKRASS